MHIVIATAVDVKAIFYFRLLLFVSNLTYLRLTFSTIFFYKHSFKLTEKITGGGIFCGFFLVGLKGKYRDETIIIQWLLTVPTI